MTIYSNNDKANCCGCGACTNVCPRDAILMQADEYGFSYPNIDPSVCIECNLCLKVCQQVNTNESDAPLKAFAASHRNKQIAYKSSSGGVFSALAHYFLENGGAVCGCVWDGNLNAVHICTDKEEAVLKIRKSKYLQSDVGLIYRDVKKRLANGQAVLFTGTPCQVAALYAVVGSRHEKLTTMDLICHGVPSQRTFDQFIHYLEKRYKTTIVEFDFRSKKHGWPRFTMAFTDSRRRTVNIGKSQEFYMPAFTGGNIIRESCLSCQYACSNRIGDITIGDLWGYEKLNLHFNTVKGTSVFTINTPAAEKWLDVLTDVMDCEEIDYADAVKGNLCLRMPTSKGEKREQYMEAIKNGNIEIMAKKYVQSRRKQIMREKLKLLVPAPIFDFMKRAKHR